MSEYLGQILHSPAQFVITLAQHGCEMLPFWSHSVLYWFLRPVQWLHKGESPLRLDWWTFMTIRQGWSKSLVQIPLRNFKHNLWKCRIQMISLLILVKSQHLSNVSHTTFHVLRPFPLYLNYEEKLTVLLYICHACLWATFDHDYRWKL